MEGRTMFVLALLVASAAASSTSASSAANAWMQSHKSPTDDQLKELQGANPAAFAVVNALLSKHMHHHAAGEMSGADVFRSMMTPAERMGNFKKPNANVPYASAELVEANAPVVQNAQYNPAEKSSRDESAVSRLLSAVASMGGNKGKKISALLKKHEHKQEVENPLTEDASLFEEAPKALPMQAIEAAAAPVPEVQAPAPEKHENSYLKGIDLSGDMPVDESQKHHVAHQQNSYLKGVDMSGADSLQSFSFGDDSAPAAPKPVKVVAPKPKKPENAFLKFLYGVKKAPAPVAQPAVAAPAKKGNSYLDSVKFFG